MVNPTNRSAAVEKTDGGENGGRDGELGDDEAGDQHGSSPRVSW
jgi:hypothetical protein